MTLQELYDAWTRYMHRNDIEADLPTIKQLTDQKISSYMLSAAVDLDDLLANGPAVFLHGGMTYLHLLAQDDVGVQREEIQFRDAADGYQRRASLTATPAGQLQSTITPEAS